MDQFRYLPRGEQLVVGEYRLATEDGESWKGPMEIVAQASLASLRKAIGARAADYGRDDSSRDQWGMPESVGRLMVSEDSVADFDQEYSLYVPVNIEVLTDGQIVLAVIGTVLDEDDVTALAALLAPLLHRSSARFIGVETEGTGARAFTWIRVTFGKRGSTVQDAIDVAMGVAELAGGSEAGLLSAHSVFSLVTAGRVELLVGLAESSWLEAKSQGYDMGTDHGKIELAQDIARFANGDEPGILIIGLRTRKTRGSDVIIKTSPAFDPFDAGRYHRAIDAKLFPPVQGLVIQNAPTRIRHGGTGNVLAIYVPTQPEGAKPFLVHGAIVGGKIEGAFISIVQRRGEHSIPVTAAAIHATLAAGRALLQRSEIPPND